MDQTLMLYVGALALGALHAFEPGHGKTIIAAYMIGTRGRTLDGILLGIIVTFTHTFSVIILGIIARLLSSSYSEQQLHTWMGLVSSLLILAVGLWMLRQRLAGKAGHTHFHLFGRGHHHDHDHHHHHHQHSDGHEHETAHNHSAHPHTHTHDHEHGHDHSHAHGHAHPHPGQKNGTAQAAKTPPSKWNLFFLGVSGGLVPCPAAIATLLAAIGAGRIAQGLTMALFFSLGLGLVMMTIGVVLAHAGRFTEKIGANDAMSRRLGILSACIITGLGGYTLYHSLLGLLAAR